MKLELEIIIAIVGAIVAIASLLGAFYKYRYDAKIAKKLETETRLQKEFEINDKLNELTQLSKEFESRIARLETNSVDKDALKEIKDLIHELRFDIKELYKLRA